MKNKLGRPSIIAALFLISLAIGITDAQVCPPPGPHLHQKVLIIVRSPPAGSPGAFTAADKAHITDQVGKFVAFLSSETKGALQVAPTQIEMPAAIAAPDYQVYESSKKTAASFTQDVERFLADARALPTDYDGIMMIYPAINSSAGKDVINNTWIYFNDNISTSVKIGPGFSSVVYDGGDFLSEALIHEYLHQMDHRFQVDAHDAAGFMNPDDMAGSGVAMHTTFKTPMDYYKAMLAGYVGSDGKIHPVDFSELGGKRGTFGDSFANMRWGTWKGTVRQTSEGKGFDLAIGGHGKFWTETKGERTAQVEFRSMSRADSLFSAHSDERSRRAFQFGHGKGSYTSNGIQHVRYVDNFKEDIPSKVADDAIVEGGATLDKFPAWTLHIVSRTNGSGSATTTPRFDLAAKECLDGVIEGRIETTSGDPATYFYSHAITTWSFTLQSGQKPRYAVLVENLPLAGDQLLESGISRYMSKVQSAVSSLSVKLSTAGKYEKSKALWTMFSAAQHDSYNTDVPRISKSWDAIRKSYNKLSRLWLSNDADADAQYSAELQNLEDAVIKWNNVKAEAEKRCVTETENLAVKAADDAPRAAADLRDLADQMKSSGAEGFARP